MIDRQVAAEILQWVSRVPGLSDQIVVGLLAALRTTGDKDIHAGATASRIATIDTLTPDQWDELVEISTSTIRSEADLSRTRRSDRCLSGVRGNSGP